MIPPSIVLLATVVTRGLNWLVIQLGSAKLMETGQEVNLLVLVSVQTAVNVYCTICNTVVASRKKCTIMYQHVHCIILTIQLLYSFIASILYPFRYMCVAHVYMCKL